MNLDASSSSLASSDGEGELVKTAIDLETRQNALDQLQADLALTPSSSSSISSSSLSSLSSAKIVQKKPIKYRRATKTVSAAQYSAKRGLDCKNY